MATPQGNIPSQHALSICGASVDLLTTAAAHFHAIEAKGEVDRAKLAEVVRAIYTRKQLFALVRLLKHTEYRDAEYLIAAMMAEGVYIGVLADKLATVNLGETRRDHAIV